MRFLLLLIFCVCTVKCRIYNDDSNKNFLVENLDNINKHYTPDWKDLDTRPLPEWYDKAKIGIFLHWGVYSVPSFGSEWFWSYWHNRQTDYLSFMKKNYPPNFTYQEFASMFKAEFYNPDQWAELFVKSGVKYIVLTSKHHEGFTLFPSKRSFSWNAVDVGPKQDLVGTLAEAVRRKGLKFGVYHSLYEWFNPIYNEDKKSSYRTKNYVNNKLWPDIKQLVNDYKPSIIWADGDWEANDTYWRSTELLAWLYNESPVKDEIVVNDRWGKGTSCKHGDFYNCFDRYNPGKLLNHKWENAFTLDKKSWGYRRNIKLNETLTTHEVLKQVVSTVSCGGNAVINVGPTKEGTIAPIFQERLLELGEWLAINGEAIYGSSPWLYQNDTALRDLWFTCNKAQYNAAAPTAAPTKTDTVNAIYAIFLKWPASNIVDIHHNITSLPCQVTLLGNEDETLQISFRMGRVKVRLPDKAKVKSKHAWTLKFTPST